MLIIGTSEGVDGIKSHLDSKDHKIKKIYMINSDSAEVDEIKNKFSDTT